MALVTARLGSTNYQCTVTDGTHQWTIDEPTEQGGGNTGPDPYAALMGSLGSCTAITLKMYAARKGWTIQHIDVLIEMQRSDNQTTFSRQIAVTPALDAQQLERLRQIAKACPVSKILEGKIHIETHIQTKN
jgi:putative redox protein